MFSTQGKDSHSEDVMNHYEDEEIVRSDDENGDVSTGRGSAEAITLREEVDVLRCQLNALKSVKAQMQAREDRMRKDQIAKFLILKKDLYNVNKELLNMGEKPFGYRKANSTGVPAINKKGGSNVQMHGSNDLGATASTSSSYGTFVKDARLFSLLTVFLNYLPFGANVDHICSFLSQADSNINAQEVENLMKRYPSIFKQDPAKIGGSCSKNWDCVIFQK